MLRYLSHRVKKKIRFLLTEVFYSTIIVFFASEKEVSFLCSAGSGGTQLEKNCLAIFILASENPSGITLQTGFDPRRGSLPNRILAHWSATHERIY
jgi:hypothetical protein